MKNLFAIFCLASAIAFAQQSSPLSSSPQTSSSQSPAGDMHDMKGMNMSGHDMSNMSAHSSDSDSEDSAMHSMEGHHMDMGPHMKMTEIRPVQPGDEERAQKIVASARNVMEKYKDYQTALNDGFHIFHPEIPQKQYHFTSTRNAMEAQFRFDPENPTSLLYEKEGNGYRLIGLMYTAPKRFTEGDLNQRVPLSIAQWHEHVNFCKAPFGKSDALSAHPRFGFRGSITTESECAAAGGSFLPIVFNWMVHVYPLEKDQAQIWSVERQHQHND